MSAEVCFPRGGTDKPSKKIVFDDDGEIASVINPTAKQSSTTKSSHNKKTQQSQVCFVCNVVRLIN